MNKRGLLGTLILIMILLVIGFFWFIKEYNSDTDLCQTDEDCIKAQTTCCPCNMGGEEKCVPKSEEEKYLKNLENCSENIICAAVFNCKIENCTCKNKECVSE